MKYITIIVSETEGKAVSSAYLGLSKGFSHVTTPLTSSFSERLGRAVLREIEEHECDGLADILIPLAKGMSYGNGT